MLPDPVLMDENVSPQKCLYLLTYFMVMPWTLAFILCKIALLAIWDPIERGIREKIVVANLAVLGGGVGACTGCLGWRDFQPVGIAECQPVGIAECQPVGIAERQPGGIAERQPVGSG